jgi:hypothetical protein
MLSWFRSCSKVTSVELPRKNNGTFIFLED